MQHLTTDKVRIPAVLCAAVFVFALLGTAGAGAATKSTVKVTTVPGVGAVLSNPRGRTLYTLTDTSGAAVECSGACASAWPPYTVSGTAKANAPKGVQSLAINRGTHQVTWKGLPLYTFSGDTAAKTANGNGLTSFGGTWNVVKSTKTAAAKTSAPTTTSSSGYGGY